MPSSERGVGGRSKCSPGTGVLPPQAAPRAAGQTPPNPAPLPASVGPGHVSRVLPTCCAEARIRPCVGTRPRHRRSRLRRLPNQSAVPCPAPPPGDHRPDGLSLGGMERADSSRRQPEHYLRRRRTFTGRSSALRISDCGAMSAQSGRMREVLAVACCGDRSSGSARS
jgi:hypothetical protein